MLTDNHFFVSSSWDKTIKVCRIDAPHTEILQINTKPREWHFDAKYSLDCKKIITSNTTNKSIRTFVVPKGVKGFVSDFMRNMHVIERFELPDGLLSIFAFGHSHIESLQLPESLQSPYSRQFKDSYIGTLRFPKEWRDSVVLGEYNELLLQGQWFDNNKYGYLRWPSTTIGTLEFY